MQRFTVGEALDRGNRLAIMRNCPGQAGIDAPSLWQHSAGAVLADHHSASGPREKIVQPVELNRIYAMPLTLRST